MTLSITPQDNMPDRNSLNYEHFIRSMDSPGVSHSRDTSETSESIHDFRNILSAIAELAEMALLELDQDGPLPAIVTGIRDACADGGVLCCRMLDSACNAAFDDEALDLSDVVNGMAVQIRACLPAAATLRFELTDSAPVEAPAPGRIRQVLLNLVRNAAEALEGGSGTVTISTGSTILESPAGDDSRLPSERNATHSFLAVSNSGAGMTEAMRGELLDRSFTTKLDKPGLGMASVRRIVHGCGGSIQILSRIGDGTQVRVLFPKVQPPDGALLMDDPLWSEGVVDQSHEPAIARSFRDESPVSQQMRASLPRSVTLVGQIQLQR